MDKRFWGVTCVTWGIGLWLVGYVLGLIFFPFVPANMIGWYVTPIGLIVTVSALVQWIRIDSVAHGLVVGFVWAGLAMLLDYLFIVMLLHPADGYYKLDVALYYASALLLPPLVAALRGRPLLPA